MVVEGLNYKHFQAGDIRRILGIDKNKLFYWINTHRLLKPGIESADGTGSRAKFSVKNLLELALIKELDEYGFDLRTIKKIIKALDQYTDPSEKNIKSIGKYFDNILNDSEELRESYYKIAITKKAGRLKKVEFFAYELEFDSDGTTHWEFPVPTSTTYGNVSEFPEVFTSIVIEVGKLTNYLLKAIGKE